MKIVFGPAPSRRLGRSLGVSNIPYKICTYACVYCQIGRTLKMDVQRREFYSPKRIYDEVGKFLEEDVDYITFVPDGEPTLDKNLGKTAEMLKDYGYPIAILTNSSLIWREDVREDLLSLDFVSLKLDSVSHELWRKIDRPHKSLELEKILDGMLEFRREFGGKVVTETMLVEGIPYDPEIQKIADFLEELSPDVAYIAIPTRPPAEGWVRPASAELVTRAYKVFSEKVRVELLTGYEGNEFSSTGNTREDILAITSVHPMRRSAIEELLGKSGESWDLVEDMVRKGELRRVEYLGEEYYIRNFR